MNIELHSIHPTEKGLKYLNGRLKRTLDILGALLGLSICTPIFLIAAIVITVVDRVPVLYRQNRIGLGGNPFVILKLRTLVIDEKRVINPERINTKPDYVTTRTGKFWRVTSTDEILQFLLVLKGEMSLIGHRPIPYYYLPHLSQIENMDQAKIEHYLETIYRYKPGMSSLSSVNGRGNLTLEQKFMYDLIYARDASFLYDIKLLFQTLYVVFTREGAK